MILRLLAFLFLMLAGLSVWCFANTQAEPVMRRGIVHMSDWPAHAAPLRIALIGDVHVQGPDMPPERVARIVAQVKRSIPT